MEVNNQIVMLINSEESQIVVLYPADENTDMLSPEAYRLHFAHKGWDFNDAFNVRQEELQYYCIDERITLTNEQNRKIAQF